RFPADVTAAEGGRNRPGGPLATAAPDGTQDFGHVDSVIDGAPDVGIVEGPATVVEGDIHCPERRFSLQPLRVLLLPPRGLPERDFGHRYPTGEKLGGAGQRLGDDAHGQRLACGRPSPIIGIRRKSQIIIVLPGDKPPRARADGTLAEVGRKGRGYDRRDRHREEIGRASCRERGDVRVWGGGWRRE